MRYTNFNRFIKKKEKIMNNNYKIANKICLVKFMQQINLID